MVQVEAVGTGRSHDGGIGNGGAVVAHNAAGAGRRQTDGAQHRLLIVVEHLDHDGGHDADGAPGGTGGEANEAGHDEDDGGQELCLLYTSPSTTKNKSHLYFDIILYHDPAG